MYLRCDTVKPDRSFGLPNLQFCHVGLERDVNLADFATRWICNFCSGTTIGMSEIAVPDVQLSDGGFRGRGFHDDSRT